VARALLELPAETVIDGEIVVLCREAKPAFHLLLGYGAKAAEVVLCAFDSDRRRRHDRRCCLTSSSGARQHWLDWTDQR
jgi:ATP-dependent DNA ligase